MPYRIVMTRAVKYSVRKTWEPPLPYGPDSLDFCIKRGIPLSDDQIEELQNHQLLIKAYRGNLVDIIGWQMGPFFVTNIIKELIEKLEPEIHNFYEIQTTFEKKSRPTDRTYYLLLIKQSADAVDLEESDTIPSRYRESVLLKTGPSAKCFLLAEKIKGMHLWRGKDPLHGFFFCSDQFEQAVRESGCKGWEFDKCDLTDRSSCKSEPQNTVTEA